MKNEEMKREMCQMCGKKLPEKEMFNKMHTENTTYYLCCQICYEQFTGRHLSGDSDIEFK